MRGLIPVATGLLALAAGLSVAPSAQAQRGMRDPYFQRYPFDKWKSEGPAAGIRWTPRALPPHLSPHQRLVVRLELALDAKEAVKRRGRGELITFIELTDSADRRWRTHEAFNLARIPEGAKPQQVHYALDIFVLPGEYQLVLAICDSATGEHSLTKTALHVAPLRTEPLPGAWNDLPAVEFVRNFDTPEVWYQPYVRGRLNVELESRRPVHVDVVMNMTPSDRAAGSIHVFRRNMSLLVPSLKVLGGITVRNGSLDLSMLDLVKRKAWTSQRENVPEWQRMREPLATANPGVVDAQSLASRGEMLRFFRGEVLGRLQAANEPGAIRVVIVLSAPVFLEHQYKPEAPPLSRDPDRRIFYIRYRPIPLRRMPTLPDGTPVPIASAMAADDLEHIVKNLNGRAFSVISPEEFRKALATILSEISHM